jgi:glycosyltransferase involved in cell wall biosynthesis
LKIVHLEAGRHLYGGALQVLLLVEGLERAGCRNLLVLPERTQVAEEAIRRGLPVKELPMAGEADLAFPFRFRKLLKAEAPELVHLHSRRGADTLGALTTRLAGIPAVLSRRVDNPEAGWSLAAKYRLFHHVITISEAIREVLIGQGVPPAKLTCVHSALDPAPFSVPCEGGAFRREFGLSDNARVVGMAAQFIERKGHGTLLEAVPRILQRHPTTRFLLFGRGPLLGEMEARTRAAPWGEAVLFPGFREDLPSFLPCLDLLVHPATREGLGIILLQASASRVPIVASRAGGIPEAVVDGETGILVEPGNPEQLAEAVSNLLADPGRRRELGRAGRQRVEAEFSVEKMVGGSMEVYRRVLDGGD